MPADSEIVVGVARQNRNELWRVMVPLIIVVALAILPLVAGTYVGGIVTEILVFSILAMSLNLLIGYTGLFSFGHAAFFSLGAYTLILLNTIFGLNAWIGLLAGVMVATVGAVAIGYLCIKVSGVSFFMLTLAFSQMLFSIAVKWRDVTGGSDGVGGLKRPFFFGLDMAAPLHTYYFALLVFLASFWAIKRLVASPLGHSFIGIRENEGRMRALGYPVQSYKLLSFVLGGMMAGLGGTAYAFLNGFVSPDAAHWSLSGEVLIMVILGGMGTLVGPVVGAAVYLLLKNIISTHTDHWMLIVGIIFIACVLLFRDGIYGSLSNLLARKWSRR